MRSHEMLTSVNRASRALSDLLRTCLSHHGLTIPQWTLLGRLFSEKQVRPVDIAKFLGVKPPFVAKILAELETQDYIQSVPFPDDERGKTIQLTAAGIQLVEHVEPMLQDCLNGQFSGVNKQDLDTYFSLNSYIAQRVSHH